MYRVAGDLWPRELTDGPWVKAPVLNERKAPGSYYIPLSYVNADLLGALGAAISDALDPATVNPSDSGKPAPGALPGNPANN